ncbi:hypothetical protein [Nocardioides caricicola]|uniref:PknH-like extracellular domain-containing protein n=1 Tax=Nocardioides caricicola TaxID=634770 RepID=A0ABW0N039_9ACTN
MPDPIDELENFSIPGPPMNPMPAAEVRRRGDRIRRRNNALATVGGIAAVAVIATPFAVFAGGQSSPDDVDPAPAPQWSTTVPDSFDIAALPEGSTYSFEVVDGSTVDDVTLCGAPAFSTASNDPAGPATDTVGATWTELESSGTADRTLAVYADGATAQTALDGFRQAVLDCGQDRTGGVSTVNDVVDRAVPGAEDSFVYTNQVKNGALLFDMTAYEVARVGNALYVANSHTSAGGDQAMDTVDLLIEHSAPVLDQMCVFSIEGCDPARPDASEGVDEPTGLTGAIPDSFPLEKGLPTDPQGGVGLEGPSHDLDLAVYNLENNLRACGVAATGLPKAIDTLNAGFRSPAAAVLRQLRTFDSVDEAQAYAEGVMAPFASCTEDPEGGVTKIYEVTPEEAGDHAASAMMRVEVDGEPGVGYQLVQVVRVGQAVLQTLVVNDGEQLDQTPEDLRRMYLENSQTVIDEMN